MKETAFPVLFFLLALLCAALSLAASAHTDAGRVVFVDGSFNGETDAATQGQTPENPYLKFSDAYKALYGTGGTLVVSGRTPFSGGIESGNPTRYDGTVVMTSKYGDTDYAKTNAAKLVITGAFHLRGDVTFENVTFVTRTYSFIQANGHKLVFGEGIDVLKGTPEDQNYQDKTTGAFLASDQYLVLRGGGESLGYDGGTYIEINSGSYSAIHCATKNRSVGGDVELVINGAERLPAAINLGNDAPSSSEYAKSARIEGDIRVRLNYPCSLTFNLNNIGYLGGSIDIAANRGATAGLGALSAEPQSGYCVVSASGDGTLTPQGNMTFAAALPENGWLITEQGDRYDEDAVLTFEAGYRKVFFLDRANKAAPIGVYSVPATDPGSSDGALCGTNPFMEYRRHGETAFHPAGAVETTGLAPGTYEVRFAAEGGYPAGESLQVLITGESPSYIVSEALRLHDERIEEIKNTPSALHAEDYLAAGHAVYYLSNDGDDSADGRTPGTAWRTVAKLSQSEIAPGSLVLFRRGDLWRERMTCKTGVHYSAYGTGPKPTFYGSPEDGADPAKWSLMPGTDNVWVYYKNIPDCGILVFDHGAENAFKEIPDYYNGRYFVRGTNTAEPFIIPDALDRDLEFFNDYTDGQTSAYVPRLTGSTLYLRCDRGNPGEVFGSIEFNTRTNVIGGVSGVILDNLCVKYGGSHGIGCSSLSGLTVQNCEVGWIGGVVQHYAKGAGEFGTVTRFGNGIEVWQNCENYRIDNCYVYQCYDAGITNQGRGSTEKSDGTLVETNAYMKGVYFTNNVLEYNVYNIEYFLSRMAKEYTKYPYPMMTDVFYTGNLMYYAGHGFGDQRPNPGNMAHIRSGGENPAVNFHIENNLFFDSVNYCGIILASNEDYLPRFRGNTFVQYRGRSLAKYGKGGGAAIPFDDAARWSVSTRLGDTEAKVVILENPPELYAVDNGKTKTLYGLTPKTAVSFDGAETWTDGVSGSLPVPDGAEEIVAYTEGDRDMYRSETVVPPVFPDFETAPDGATLTALFGDEVFLPRTVTTVSDALAFPHGKPKTVYLPDMATSVVDALTALGLNCRFYGDVDGDGRVSFEDVTCMLDVFSRGESFPDSGAADVNFDGKEDLLDLSKLVRYLGRAGDGLLGRR